MAASYAIRELCEIVIPGPLGFGSRRCACGEVQRGRARRSRQRSCGTDAKAIYAAVNVDPTQGVSLPQHANRRGAGSVQLRIGDAKILVGLPDPGGKPAIAATEADTTPKNDDVARPHVTQPRTSSRSKTPCRRQSPQRPRFGAAPSQPTPRSSRPRESRTGSTPNLEMGLRQLTHVAMARPS